MDFNLNLLDIMTEHESNLLDESRVYDVLIVGGGPAALTAAVYIMRKGLSAGVIVKKIGGQLVETQGIENYMGYKYIEGEELVGKFKEQVKQFDIGFKESTEVTKLELEDKLKVLHLSDGTIYKSKAVIISTGSTWKKLGIPGEKELTGHGVAYCTTCDAPFFKDKKVAVIGGGNSGIEAALDLAKIASEVVIMEYMDSLKADKILLEKLDQYDNIKINTSYAIKEIKGNKQVTSAIFEDRKKNELVEINLDGVFVEIGTSPNTGFLEGVINLNKLGEIVVDCACKTNIEGIYAAGDCTSVPFKQIIIAAGEGAKAGLSAYDYIMKL